MTDHPEFSCKIHPAIGIARIGNSENDYFIGPEVPDQAVYTFGKKKKEGEDEIEEKNVTKSLYKDDQGALKRQVARFRIFEYDKDGKVIRELEHGKDGCEIEWKVELANKKSAWYQFQVALDIPIALDPTIPPSARRNASIENRSELMIMPTSKSISGCNQKDKKFDDGTFRGEKVPLGELRTDKNGNLLVFGGEGLSRSITGNPPTITDDPPTTFANNDGWHDDTSDGPVTATVTINGKTIKVEGAWVVVAPPNYAPTLNTVRTMYDLLYDRMVAWELLWPPSNIFFEEHIRPIFERLSRLQWVNQGFASWFGAGTPFDFDQLLPRLRDNSPGNKEFRQRIFEQFRNPLPYQQNLGKNLWPPFYGDGLDAMTGATPDSSKNAPDGLSSLSELQLSWLKKWADGEFDNSSETSKPKKFDDNVDISQRPALLDKAALDFCLADAFHPGCEMTWPMRIRSLYSGPFRIKHRKDPKDNCGPVLTPEVALSKDGPIDGAAPGDITRWMAVPWQTDTASCLSGYGFFKTSPSLPTFWPARVPNDVLREADYKIVMNTGKSPGERLSAFARRRPWLRILGSRSPIARMIKGFHLLGIIEERDGPKDPLSKDDLSNVPRYPSRIWVESEIDEEAVQQMLLAEVDSKPETTVQALLTAADAEPAPNEEIKEIKEMLLAEIANAAQVQQEFSKLRRPGKYGK